MDSANFQHWRVEVGPAGHGADGAGRAALAAMQDAGVLGVESVAAHRVYLLTVEADEAGVGRIGRELLADPVTERAVVSGSDQMPAAEVGAWSLEVHLRPGVMDPAASSALAAIREMGFAAESVRTAVRYVVRPQPAAAEHERIGRALANDCVQEVIEGGRAAGPAPEPARHPFAVRHVELSRLDEAGLTELSRRGHLFLTLEEMRAIQLHFESLGREPTDLELETLAQTWSEHCVHKTLKSEVVYRGAGMPENSGQMEVPSAQCLVPSEEKVVSGQWPVVSARSEGGVEIRYGNLLRDTIARATRELMAENRGPECLSVFKDNAGVIGFDDDFGIAFKVETHNRPSAIEPYGGAATGVGGCIRDVMGCGLGAKPIANTDVFCVAPPDWPLDAVPRGVIHPRAVLRGVVAGVRDYGNRMGIPTVNGAVYFDPRYLGNPLVFCGCVGLIPRDKIDKAARPGDWIVVVGGRTGRDGIHGATFSSAELTDTHADEFSHAVQIGNAIEEKKCLDVIIQARDHADGCLYSAITDCGAGGLSSAVGEMAAETGAEVDLEKVTLKYAGLRYDEIWISESQERMVLAVPPERFEALRALAAGEGVEATAIGCFTNSGRLVVRFDGTVVGDLDLAFVHDGLPKQVRQAEWWPDAKGEKAISGQRPAVSRAKPNAEIDVVRGTGHDKLGTDSSLGTEHWALGTTSANPQSPQRDADLVSELKRRLSDPTIASKEWIIRQYDHEVQGRSVVKPLVGARQDGPGDAAVIRPRFDSPRGIAIGCGLCPQLYDVDPYWMAVAAIDEAIRNVVCVGGDPTRTAILDNFCWPRTDDPRQMGALVRACQGCYDAAKAYGVPFISGKDSLNNEFSLDVKDVEKVRATIRNLRANQAHGLRSVGLMDDARDSMNGMRDNRIAIPGTLLISAVSLIDDVSTCKTMDFKRPGREILYAAVSPYSQTMQSAGVHRTIHRDLAAFSAIHDISEGGLLTALAEMCIASGFGARINVASADRWGCGNGGYLVEGERGHPFLQSLGSVSADSRLIVYQGATFCAIVQLRISAKHGNHRCVGERAAGYTVDAEVA